MDHLKVRFPPIKEVVMERGKVPHHVAQWSIVTAATLQWLRGRWCSERKHILHNTHSTARQVLAVQATPLLDLCCERTVYYKIYSCIPAVSRRCRRSFLPAAVRLYNQHSP